MNSDPKNASAVFVGCARNCAPSLGPVLSNVEAISKLFSASAYVFIENDSSDSTRKILQQWGHGRAGFQLVDLAGLAMRYPPRTPRLAQARNTYLHYLRSSALKNYHYLFVMDFEGINACQMDLRTILQAIDFLEEDESRAAVFANQMNRYYDIWALRHKTLCPKDVWEEVWDYAITNGVSDEIAFRQIFKNRLFSVDPQAPALEVDSAFGGLGIYKLAYALRSSYEGTKIKLVKSSSGSNARILVQVCEHVAFHKTIRDQGGRLFVLPWLINNILPPQTLNPSFFRTLIIGPA